MPLQTERATKPQDPHQSEQNSEGEVPSDLRNRLATAHGHLGAIRRMIEAKTPLPPVLFQLRALERALEEISLLVIRHHLYCCLDDPEADVDARLAAID